MVVLLQFPTLFRRFGFAAFCAFEYLFLNVVLLMPFISADAFWLLEVIVAKYKTFVNQQFPFISTQKLFLIQ